jgi:protein-L-isoaspartate(D-aspartate) O-methyltransferase
VLHVGAGLGYFTAIMAECAGSEGHVVAYEVDEPLADGARRNLASRPWVDVHCGDGSAPGGGRFDAILVNAGVTHPLDAWLDALAPGGRLMIPITAAMLAMGSTLGKGVVLKVERTQADTFAARVAGVVAVYSALGIRDEAMNERIGQALMGGPMKWQTVARLRRDAHEPSASCWLHGHTSCFSAVPQ